MLVSTLRKADCSQGPPSVARHSLGAAYVALLAMELTRQGMRNLTVITYGQPRVGDAAFAAAYARAVAASGSASWRLTHYADPVPHLPLEDMGFRHHPVEVHYDELNRHYHVCDGSGEDHACADGVAVPLLLTDHWTYLGINLDQFVACKVVEVGSVCGSRRRFVSDVLSNIPGGEGGEGGGPLRFQLVRG